MNILVDDDHTLFREGLVNLLETQPDMTVVGEAETVSQAILKACELKPDLILLDYRLPDGNGPDAARAILAELPETDIVFLTIHEDEAYLLSAIRSGAMGYLVKDTPFNKLTTSIRALANHEPALTRKMTLSLMYELAHPRAAGEEEHSASLADLTHREVEFLKQLAADASNQEIAEQFSISVATVKNSLHNLFHKLHLNSRKEAAIYARHQGLGAKVRH